LLLGQSFWGRIWTNKMRGRAEPCSPEGPSVEGKGIYHPVEGMWKMAGKTKGEWRECP